MKIIADHRENNPYRRCLIDNLVAYNDANGPPECWHVVGFYALDDEDHLIGGIQGNFEWNWLHIRHFWVKEPQNGLGRQLMEKIETYAREKKIAGALLNTFAFQARGFYEKMGYEVFGEIKNAAGPHSRFFLKKNFN